MLPLGSAMPRPAPPADALTTSIASNRQVIVAKYEPIGIEPTIVREAAMQRDTLTQQSGKLILCNGKCTRRRCASAHSDSVLSDHGRFARLACAATDRFRLCTEANSTLYHSAYGVCGTFPAQGRDAIVV